MNIQPYLELALSQKNTEGKANVSEPPISASVSSRAMPSSLGTSGMAEGATAS